MLNFILPQILLRLSNKAIIYDVRTLRSPYTYDKNQCQVIHFHENHMKISIIFTLRNYQYYDNRSP